MRIGFGFGVNAQLGRPTLSLQLGVPGVTPTPTPAPSLSALSLAASSIQENAASGTIVGGLLGKTSGSTLSLVDAAGGRFAISGGNLVAGATTTDFETSTSHQVTVHETLAGATNSPRDTVLTVTVTNLFEQPSLSALSFSGAGGLKNGTAATGAISGATAGSTIAATGLPAGFTINGPARTWSFDGSAPAGSSNVTLTETLADSANSPRATAVTVTIGAAAVAPVLSSGPIALAALTTGVGSSSFSGTGADNVSSTYNSQAKASVTDPAKISIAGYGGSGTEVISDGVKNLTSDQKAGHIIVSWLGNDTTTGEDVNIIPSIDGALASLPNLDRFWFLNKFLAQNEGPGGVKGLVNRRYEALYPANFIDWSWLMMKCPPLTSADIANQQRLRLQPSYAAGGGTDTKHQNDLGYQTSYPFSFDPLLRGMAGEIPYVADGRRVFSRASTAYAAGGFVADMVVLHSLAGCVLSTTSADFAFAIQSDKVIRITRASSTVLKSAYTLVPLTITKTVDGQPEYRTVNLRISLGAQTTTPAVVRFGYAALNRLGDNKPLTVTNTKKCSFVVGIRITDPDLASTAFVPIGGSGLGVSLSRSAGGLAAIRFKNAANTTVGQVQISGGLTNTTDIIWFFAEYDGDAGYCRAYRNETLTNGTYSSSDTLNLTYPPQVGGGGDGLSNVCSSPSYPMEVVGPFFYNDIIGVTDPSVGAARRALFRNPASPNVPLDLGSSCAVNGITPYVALRGNAADLYQGAAGTDGWNAKNFGSGGDYFSVHVPAFRLETV